MQSCGQSARTALRRPIGKFWVRLLLRAACTRRLWPSNRDSWMLSLLRASFPHHLEALQAGILGAFTAGLRALRSGILGAFAAAGTLPAPPQGPPIPLLSAFTGRGAGNSVKAWATRGPACERGHHARRHGLFTKTDWVVGIGSRPRRG